MKFRGSGAGTAGSNIERKVAPRRTALSIQYLLHKTPPNMSTPLTTKPMPPWIETPHPRVVHSLITFPAKHILLVTINRPEFRNCLPVEGTIELGALWKWYDAEPELRCAVFTGAGDKAFCAGMDLKQRLDLIETGEVAHDYPPGQFAGMSNRTGKKPIIVACNGHAHGTDTRRDMTDFNELV